ITGAADKPGLRQWVADNTAAFAVANVDALLNRSEMEGYGFLRWRWKNEPKLDADADLRNWHGYVLNDAADLGTWFHGYAEAILRGDFPEREPQTDWQYELAEQLEAFLSEHEVEPVFMEQTVYNPVGYAGTLDLMARIDGVPTLCDWKTSRRVQDAHKQQLAALGAAPGWLRRVPQGEGVLYKRKQKPDTWWVEDAVPEFSQYAILQFRPTDDDGTPAYYRMHIVNPEEIALHYEAFLGYLTAKEAERKVRAWNNNNKEEK